MANVFLFSPSSDFAADLKEQLRLYASDFEVFDEWSDEVIFDAAVVDEDITLASELKQKLRKAPIIFLKSSEKAKDDSLVVLEKPLRLETLLDVVLSSINLYARSSDGQLSFGSYVLDNGKKEITCVNNGNVVKLTEREVAILNYLYKAHTKTVSKNELLSEVWGYNPDATTHTVETHIYRLRQKIEEGNSDQAILTEEAGYTLNF